MTDEIKKARDTRVACGLTQAQLGKMLGLSGTTIWAIEHGHAGKRVDSKKAQEDYFALMALPMDQIKAKAKELGVKKAKRIVTMKTASKKAVAKKAQGTHKVIVEGNKLADIRVALGLSQQDMRDKTGIPQAYISRIETGTPMDPSIVKRYQDALEKLSPEKPAPAPPPLVDGKTLKRIEKPEKTGSEKLEQLLLQFDTVTQIPGVVTETPKPQEEMITFAGKFIPSGSNGFDHIDCDGRTLYTFTAVPGGVWMAVVGTYHLDRQS